MDQGAGGALWTESPGRKRGPRPRFTLDDIVATAIAIADADGLDAVTMQRVADDLGAAKMGLYRYVPGKVELCALMLDRALGEPPREGPAGWRAQLEAWALTMHRRMAPRPWTLELTVGRRVPGPRELAWFENGLAALRDTPLDGAERLDVLALLSNHVRGSVQQMAAATDPESALAESLQPILQAHADRFPQTAAAFESAATSGRRDEGFKFGVDRILDGVATLMQKRARAR